MSKDLLLEVGADEIPARYLLPAIEELKNRAVISFKKARLRFEEIKSFGTPRRLVLYVRKLAEKSDDISQKVRGPSKKVAYDAQGNPTRALIGFSKSLGVDPSQVTVERINGGEYVFGVKHEKGRPVGEILPNILPSVVMGMDCPHPLRWGEWRWYRPIRWVVCLYGKDVIPVEIAGRRAGRVTYGHRTLHPGQAQIDSAGAYFDVMEKIGVVVDHERRKNIISQGVLRLSREIDGFPLEDEDLLQEVTCLCEHPAPFLGRFDEKYLRLPREVLVTVMRHHQRYFPVVDKGGNVLPGFVGVRDGDPDFGMETVRSGNEWVIRARLEDASFFYDQDLRKKLESRIWELKGVYFLRGAGTLYDKTFRLQEIVKYTGQRMGLSLREQELAEKAAWLSKCDLVTLMVREFPELEGIVGGHYARAQGLEKEVCDAISQQYLPRSIKDPVPDKGIGALLAMADKLDTLSVAFSLGIEVSGSQDPLGLRRSAQGVVNIILYHEYDLDLDEILRFVVELAQKAVERPSPSAAKRLKEFLSGRLEVSLSEKGFGTEVVRAVLTSREKRIARLPKMARALSSLIGTEKLSDIVTGWRRTSVLAKNYTARDVSEDLLREEAEICLYREIECQEQRAWALFENKKYDEYLQFLASLRPAIDRCLDEVLIMAKEPRVKENRLKLLGVVSDFFAWFASFSHILPLVSAARTER